MATQLQIRRGTSTQVAAFTGAEGEIVVNTTNDSVHVNDGSTAGGFELARADFNNISASATLTIGTLNTTNLDLTNLEVTNIKAKDGTAAGSIADSTGVVTLISSSLTTADITTLKIGGSTVTSTAAELNILDGVTSTAAELNILDGVTATTAELNYVDGVTSAIQAQIDAKAPIANPTFTGSFTSPGIDDNADAIAITIDSSENVGIGTGSPSSFYSTSLVVNVPDEDGITIVSPTTGLGYLMFADGTSGNARFRGFIGYEHDGDLMQFATSGVERLRIDSSGKVGIGISSPQAKLHSYTSGTGAIPTGQFNQTSDDNTALTLINANNSATYSAIKLETRETQAAGWMIANEFQSAFNGDLVFRGRDGGTSSAEVLRLKSNGIALFGKTAVDNTTQGIQIDGPSGFMSVARDAGIALLLDRSNSGEIQRFTENGSTVGSISVNNSRFTIEGPDNPVRIATGTSNIQINHDTHISFDTAGSEAMRISGGNLLVGTTDTTLFNNTSEGGIGLMASNRLDVARAGDVVATFNRMTNDGSIIQFYAQGALEGSIDVSGNTVSLVGFSGAHASSGVDVTTAKGTVVSTIDQEHKNNHAKIKISDSEGDARVYGVIDRISEEGDIIVSGVGIGEVKVTGACAGGDLLESNGDGTAKVQSDDIIRSKTIGKVTIGNGDEGVKLVSCVLYCG